MVNKSIAINTISLNSETTISRCLESVKAQVLEPTEYIVVDGQSTDNTLALIEKAAEDGTVSKFICEPDLGVSDAFNKAWKASNSEYIVFLNSDDWIEPDFISRATDCICKDDPDIVISNLNFNSGLKSRVLKPAFPSELPPPFWYHPVINHPGMIIRKKLLEQLGGYNLNFKIAMDVELFYRALNSNPRISYLDAPLVHQADGGLSQTRWRTAVREMLKIERMHGRNPALSKVTFYYRYANRYTRHVISSIRKHRI